MFCEEQILRPGLIYRREEVADRVNRQNEEENTRQINISPVNPKTSKMFNKICDIVCSFSVKCSSLTRTEVAILNRFILVFFNQFNIKRGPRWPGIIVHLALLLLLGLSTTSEATEVFCPKGCSCTDINAECDRLGLDIVPYFFNPRVAAISLADNDLHSLQGIDLYPDLRTLDLAGNHLLEINKNTFEMQKVLKALTLSNNTISSLEEDSFNGLINLEYLSMNDNSLSRIRDRVFKGLDSLETLSLANNKIKDIETLGFEYLISIKSINLAHNRLDKVPASGIVNLLSLEDLDLSDNQISEVPANAFYQLETLRYLDLSRNNISVIQPDSFNGLEKLRSLSLVANRLSVIPINSFPPFKSLSFLDLSGNLFKSLQRNFLGNLPSLISLKIERCPQLTSVSPEAFVNGWALHDLSLRQNPLLSILPPASLAPLLALKTLDLSSCGLKGLQPTQVTGTLALVRPWLGP